MICPHCQRDLKRKERSDYRCYYCRRQFALEPKEGDIVMHDVRVRKLADKLSDGGRLRYTLPQLWYAAARGRLRDPVDTAGVIGCTVVGLSVFVQLPIAVISSFDWGLILSAVLIMVGVWIVTYLVLKFALVPWCKRNGKVPMPEELEKFRSRVRRWEVVYREPPPRMADETNLVVPEIAEPRVAIVVPDRAVLACLAASGVPGEHEAALVGSLAHVPPGVPVIVLHDASPQGIRLACEARAAFGARTVTPGLRPNAVMGQEKAIKLRERRPTGAEMRSLRDLRPGLTEDELTWLGNGWYTPLASVPPAKLLAALTRAITRATSGPGAETATAERVGFLTWPGA
ncbi:hypothetical protein SAMN05421630_10235 [Prauserella marina]|uniref:Uncharacterized protein n=2 Tax=Prauserella marina TaxID=530584 RepID=A0A1G6LFE3_9PSEU|nr:hypothetical protein DES30_1011957 [Prauserella marina]SDC42142.1 hypothetical protein SAMN05421630_10235 [Prauserella marina]